MSTNFKIFLTSMRYIEVQLLILSIIIITKAQTQPNWTASPHLYTGKFIAVNNLAGSNTNSSLVKTFATAFTSTPQVMLCNFILIAAIVDLAMTSNGNFHGIKVFIFSINSVDFTCWIRYFNNARIFNLNVEYLAYTNATLGNELHIYYNSYPTTIIDGLPSPARVLSQAIVYHPTYSISPYTSIVCVPFLIGFEGESSDYYKLNLSIAATSNTDIVVTATVDYYTIINQIIFYSLIINKEYLQTQCRYFVDIGSTFSINGIQQTFFTPPKGFFPSGYITGWVSMTLRDNVNFNLTTYGTYNSRFLTDTVSNYTQMSHLNFRVRDCVSPCLYYSKLDGLCYNQCPGGTYLISAYVLCQVCHWSCLTCIINTACATCKTNSAIDTGTGYCTCDLKFYLSSQSCVACHYSCRTCSGDQYNQCNTCVGAQYRLLNAAQSTCPCTTGYKDVGQATCQQICGDGLIYTDQCDDGNTDSGDGCSSTCQIEANFSCSSTPSDCIYTGTISLQYVQAEKQPYSNRAKFYIRLSPFINLMSKLAGTDAFFTITSGLSATRTQFDSEQNLFIFSGEMSKDFENQNMIIFLKSTSTGLFRAISQTNTTFTSKSINGLKLVVYTENYNKDAQNLNIASQVFGCLILFMTLFFCLTQWKYIGNQMYFTIQTVFICFCFLQQFKPTLVSVCGLHYIMGYNGLIGQKRLPYLNQPSMQYMGYSIPYQYNVNFMLIPQGISLILFLIYKIFFYFDSKLDISQSRRQTWYGKITSLFNIQLFVFWTLFNANNFIVSTIIQGQDTTYPGIFVYVAVCLLTIIIALIPVLIIPDSVPSYRNTPFHTTHGRFTFILTLIGVVIMDIILLFSVILVNQFIYLIPVYPLAMIIYAIYWRPFVWMIDTVRFALNNLCIILGMCLIYVLDNVEDKTLYAPVGILILILIIVLMNAGIYVALIIMYFKNLNKQPKVQQQIVEIKHQQSQQSNREMDDQVKIKDSKCQLQEGIHTKTNLLFCSRQMRPQKIKQNEGQDLELYVLE